MSTFSRLTLTRLGTCSPPVPPAEALVEVPVLAPPLVPPAAAELEPGVPLLAVGDPFCPSDWQAMRGMARAAATSGAMVLRMGLLPGLGSDAKLNVGWRTLVSGAAPLRLRREVHAPPLA
jgi:hypothetical protein